MTKKQHPAQRDPGTPPQNTADKPVHEDTFDATTPTRGSSIQGEGQDAKGGPAGANQGGAPRGGSRIEPSHQQRAAKKDK